MRASNTIRDEDVRFIHSEMLRRGWNTYRLAEVTGVSYQTLSGLFSGRVGNPRHETLVCILDGLGFEFEIVDRGTSKES